MSKEYLELLKIIDELLDNYIDEAQVVDCPMTKERLLFLKQALQRLESIDNANTSEALEIINNMLNGVEEFEFINLEMVLTKDLDKVKRTLLKTQELERLLDHERELNNHLILKEQENEKVLNIIKEKCLHTENLNYVAVCSNYDMYKEKMSKKYDTVVVKINWNDKSLLDYLKLLTQEEFKTIKEMV